VATHVHTITSILLNLTDDNIKNKMDGHIDEVIKVVKTIGLTNAKVVTKISNASAKEIHIQSLIENGDLEI